MTILQDMAEGEAFELQVAESLREYYNIFLHKNPDITGIDLVWHKNVEVKLDRRFRETGNIFVEFTFKKQPSGINKYPECNLFVVGDKDMFLVFTPQKLINFCKKNGKKINAWDGWNSVGYLIRVNEVKNISEFIFDSSK